MNGIVNLHYIIEVKCGLDNQKELVTLRKIVIFKIDWILFQEMSL